MNHHCHAVGCKTVCRPELLMCAKHWRMVSRKNQIAVLRAYREGQCDDKDVTQEWLNAANSARREVAEKTGHLSEFLQERLALEMMKLGLDKPFPPLTEQEERALLAKVRP